MKRATNTYINYFDEYFISIHALMKRATQMA